MARPKKVFGRLFYSTLVIALVAAGYKGVITAWPRIAEWRELRSLEGDLRSADPITREAAVGPLSRKGIAVCVPYLLQAARDPREEVRALACRSLVSVGADSPTVLPVLIGAAGDDESEVRREAAVGFGRLAAYAPQAARWSREWPAGLTPGESSECVRVLCRLLKDREVTVRAASARSLGETGPDPAAHDDLVAALRDDYRAVRFAAARALLRADGAAEPSAVAIFVALFSDPEWVADDREALEALKDLGAEVQGQALLAIAGLLARVDLSDRRNEIRHHAIDTLVTFGPAARPALPALEALLNDTDPDLRAHAVLAVVAIEGKDRPGMSARLLGIVTDRAFTFDRRTAALGVLREISPAAMAKASQALIRQLGDADRDVRGVAVTLLIDIVNETPAEMPSPPGGP
jgi:HEAT repeat protein